MGGASTYEIRLLIDASHSFAAPGFMSMTLPCARVVCVRLRLRLCVFVVGLLVKLCGVLCGGH